MILFVFCSRHIIQSALEIGNLQNSRTHAHNLAQWSWTPPTSDSFHRSHLIVVVVVASFRLGSFDLVVP